MKNSIKILISVFAFAVCGCIGYFGTGLIKGDFVFDKQNTEATADAIVSDSGSGSISTETVSTGIGSVGRGLKGSNSAKANDDGPVNTNITREHPESNNSKTEAAGPAKTESSITNGKVVLEDVKQQAPVQEDKPVYKVDKITKAELEEVLNSGSSDSAISHSFKNRVAANCAFTFSGLDENDVEVPRSYNDIIMRISLGTWSRVSAISVTYNENDKLKSASFNVEH